MMNIYVEMSGKSVIAQALVSIVYACGCTVVEDIEDADRVVCLYANHAMSLMKQTGAVIDILVLPIEQKTYNVAIEALTARFPERINLFHIIANDGTEEFPLLLKSWIGGNK